MTPLPNHLGLGLKLVAVRANHAAPNPSTTARAGGRRPEWERPAQNQSPKTRRRGQGVSALTCQGPSRNGPAGSRPPKTCCLLPGFNRED